jgi:hypothetical protein
MHDEVDFLFYITALRNLYDIESELRLATLCPRGNGALYYGALNNKTGMDPFYVPLTLTSCHLADVLLGV